MSPYASLYFSHLEFSPIHIATLMSMFQVTRIVGPFAWGWLADCRKDRLGIMRTTTFLACLIFSGIFFLKGYWALLLWMFLLNTVISSLMPLGESATVHALFKDNAFDKRYGRLRLWGSIGFIVMVMAAGQWFERYGIDDLPILGMTTLIILMFLTWGLREPPVQATPTHHTPFLHVFRNVDLWWFLSANFWMIFGHAALYVFYSLYLNQMGYSKSEIGIFWMLGVLAEVIFFYFQNTFFSRFKTTHILKVVYLMTAIRFALIAYLPITPILVVAQLMHSGTFAAHHSGSLKMLQTWFTGHSQARGQALHTSVSYGLGGTVGGLAAGWVWEHWGAAHVFGVAAISGLIGYYCMYKIKR